MTFQRVQTVDEECLVSLGVMRIWRDKSMKTPFDSRRSNIFLQK